MKTIKSGTAGWIVLAALVVGWDYGVALRGEGETLSNAFRRATRHPFARWPVILAWAVTTVHLFGWIPRKVDPFVLLGSHIGPRQ